MVEIPPAVRAAHVDASETTGITGATERNRLCSSLIGWPTWTVTDFPDVFAKNGPGRTNGSGRGKIGGFRTINAAGDELMRPNLSRRFR